ncbi:universal stress protein [Flavitalea flava]
MPVAFNKVLIPVDFSLNTKMAVKKAVGLIEPQNSFLHLLHVLNPMTPWKLLSSISMGGFEKVKVSRKYLIWEAEKKLAEWRLEIEEILPGVKVVTNIRKGASIQNMIVQTAKLLGPDLIIIGKQDTRRRWPFSSAALPDYIAKLSNCPVLTLKPGSIHHKTKIIVVPVRDFVPERKLELAIMIAGKYRAQVHLVTFPEINKLNQGKTSKAFLQTYHQLRERLHHPIEHISIPNQNPAKATLDYAKSIMADMILVNPETESGISSFIGSRHISDLLPGNSKIQILDVQPYVN